MVFAAFFVATAVVLAISAYCAWRDFKQFGDVLGASQLLMIVLGLSVICRTVAPPGGVGNMVWLSIVDLAALMVSAYWFVTRKALWCFVLCFTFIAQLVAHAGFWRGFSAGIDGSYAYILCLNVLAVLQLVAVGWPGARHVAGVFGALLHDRRARGFRFSHGAHQ